MADKADSVYHYAVYTGTGEQPIIEIPPGHWTTFTLVAGDNDSVDIQHVKSTATDAPRVTFLDAQNGTVTKCVDSPHAGLCVDITTNVSGNITFEALSFRAVR